MLEKVKKMTNEIEFLSYISEAMQEKYNVTSFVADEIIKNSKISKMIYTYPEFVMHYNVEDWADELMSTAMAR